MESKRRIEAVEINVTQQQSPRANILIAAGPAHFGKANPHVGLSGLQGGWREL